jgi:type II secretory ATPase GspE/PulE/Tfp pilus assembly ATPase PilB-like protein
MNILREKLKDQLALEVDAKTIRVIDKLLNYAVGIEADEIYFEPETERLAVIFRAGGEVKNKIFLPKKIEDALLSGLQEMAGADRGAPDGNGGGKFKKDYLGYKIIFSLAKLPTAAGERIIIDLDRENFELLQIGRLGLAGKNLAVVKNNLAGRKGLILVIGGFNSGRTTTLYSFLNCLSGPELNLTTVESDIAFDLPEINQSRLDPISGYGSREAMNSLRRQDIDAAMIGEIFDRATAETALHLARAGHLVLAGFYGRDFMSALSFFQDLGIAPSLFADNIKLVVTQSLIGRNCPYCLGRQRLGRAAYRRLEEKLSLNNLLPRLKAEKIISEKIRQAEDLVFYKSGGCPRCRNSGTAGKIGIFEVLAIDSEVKKLIGTGHFSAIQSELEKQGGYGLAQDALAKALQGLTSVEEVFKIAEQ